MSSSGASPRVTRRARFEPRLARLSISCRDDRVRADVYIGRRAHAYRHAHGQHTRDGHGTGSTIYARPRHLRRCDSATLGVYTSRADYIYCELVGIGSSCLCGTGQGRVCVGYVLGGEGKGERSRISVMVFESMDRYI